jgi:ABC-type sugar transport systems, ATPase components
MMASKAIKPVYEVFKDAGINFDESQFVPTVAGYYTDSKTGHLLSQPFNSSTPVLYYNKDAFKKAGLDPEQPPKTWQDLAEYTAKLKAAGMKCGYASGWQGWIQIENFSAWHGLPVATKNNGFDGTDAVLEFNKPEQVKHIALLEALNKKGDFSYFGRKDESTEKFYNGDCAITTASSGSLADIRHYAKFNYGVGMTLAQRVMVMNKGIAEQIGTPVEVYEKPATRFVASFIGSPAMNLLEGHISNAGTHFELESGMAIPINWYYRGYAGRKMTLGIRPEHIGLTSQAEGGVPLVMDTLEMLGADNLAHGRWGEQKLVVRLAHQERPKAGSTLWLHLPENHLHFFDGETGQRV